MADVAGPSRGAPTVLCPVCAARVEATDEDTGELIHPGPGDIALCPRCGQPSIFTGNGLQARLPTEAERDELLTDPAVRGWMAKVRAVESVRAEWHEN
jgi:hypothetical protein